MTGLFRNLASVARGEPIPGAARVALPPRFAATAPAARGVDLPPQDEWLLESQPPPPPPRRPLQSTTAANDPAAPQPPRHNAQTESDEAEPRPRAVAMPESQSVPITPATPPMAPAEIAPPPPAPHNPLPPKAAHRDAPPPRNDTTTSVRAPPLGDAVLAGQSLRRRETPPVIQVTIDRIDIRSPEPPRAAGAGKAQPKPSVSLADYLRRSVPGGRT